MQIIISADDLHVYRLIKSTILGTLKPERKYTKRVFIGNPIVFILEMILPNHVLARFISFFSDSVSIRNIDCASLTETKNIPDVNTSKNRVLKKDINDINYFLNVYIKRWCI